MMTVQKYRTNLNCGSCVAAVKPHLDNDPIIRRWSVDTAAYAWNTSGARIQFVRTSKAQAKVLLGIRWYRLAGDATVHRMGDSIFRAEVGITPARYVERLRLEAARRRLEESEEPVAAVAAACGFGTAETMRRVFLRALGVGPAEYRRRFHATAAAPGTAA